jgi:hypothetical protein
MKIFDFDPNDYAETYSSHQFVHIREGVSEEFHDLLVKYAKEKENSRLDDFAIKGKKEQSLFEFPETVNFPDELFDVVSQVCGLNRETMTLSERHIKSYDANAAPDPPAHKDRFPSQVSVGLSIDIPEESRLVLYPYEHRGVNAFNKAADFYASLQPDELPEVVLKTAREVEVDDRARDVVMFAGSSIWHERRHAARALNLYLKLNDFGCDPLGEDPATADLRSSTMSALKGSNDKELDGLIPVLSRRFDTASRVYLRNGEESLRAELFGEPAFGITQLQFEALRAINGGQPLATAVGQLAGKADDGDARAAFLYLADRGAIELVSAPAA